MGRRHLTSGRELPRSIGNVLDVFEKGIISRYCRIILYYIRDGNYLEGRGFESQVRQGL